MSSHPSFDPQLSNNPEAIQAFFLERLSPAQCRDLLSFTSSPHPESNIWLWAPSPFTDGLHFLSLDVALAQAQLFHDRHTASTWAEYVQRCDPRDYCRAHICGLFDCPTFEEFQKTYQKRFPNHGLDLVKTAYRNIEGSPPLDEDPFDFNYVMDLEEYWKIPALLFQPEPHMHNNLPSDIEDRYGEYRDTFEEGETLMLPVKHKDLILEEFRHLKQVAIEDSLLLDTCNNVSGPMAEIQQRIDWYRQALQLLANLSPETRDQLLQALPAPPTVKGCSPEVRLSRMKYLEWPTTKGQPRALPRRAVHLLTQEFHVEGLIESRQSCYFVRHKTIDQLWVSYDGVDLSGSLLQVPRSGLGYDAAEFLVSHFLKNPDVPGNHGRLLEGGLFNEEDFTDLLKANEREHQEALERVRHNELSRNSTILVAAEELGLSPKPVGSNDTSWYGQCPGRNHHLMISTAGEEFGCGYCKVKGGVEELRVLVGERNKR